MSAPKKNTLMIAVYEILTHFLVKPILFYGRGEVRLEAAGTRAQVELAQYICDFLQVELEKLWREAAREQGLKGLRAKNSFLVGIARGFSEKLHGARSDLNPSDSKALVKVEAELAHTVAHFMGGLSSSHSGQVLDSAAHESGREQGHKLNIRPAVKGSSSTLYLPRS
jgi:hypothetical protein